MQERPGAASLPPVFFARSPCIGFDPYQVPQRSIG